MWFAIAIASVALAALVAAWRLSAVGRTPPDENSPERQHEVPGAHAPPPTLPD